MSKFLYPVDTDQFQFIRETGRVYVDKTDMVYNLVNKYQYVFLARPRRFGKSLLCNTFKAYFQGQKELFEGLKIMSLEKEWKKYPVLHFSMSGLKNCTIPEARKKLESLIRGYESIYGANPLAKTPGTRLHGIIHNAYKQTGEKVVFIIDEYDSPIMHLMYEPEQLDAIQTMLGEFYQVLKDEGAYIKFVFITGITKFSPRLELNNINQISLDDEYSGICGITQDELDTVLRPCVEEYADSLKITVGEAYAILKKNYDGYHFSKNSQKIYAPYSLLNALSDKDTGCYWFESSTMTSLIDHLKHYSKFNPLDFDGIELTLNNFNSPCERAETPIPLLYQSGYLTIASYDKDFDSYTLHFPNYEVSQGMIDGITNYLMDTDDIERNSVILEMAHALSKGNLTSALYQLRSYIASIPYDIITKKEWMQKKSHEAFYKLLMYIIFSLLNSKIDTEVKSVLGRADVVIKTKTDIFVLELKVDDTVDNALAQIDNKGYAIPYEAEGRKVTKCGAVISSKARNITQWRVVGSDGNIIDEQKYK